MTLIAHSVSLFAVTAQRDQTKKETRHTVQPLKQSFRYKPTLFKITVEGQRGEEGREGREMERGRY